MLLRLPPELIHEVISFLLPATTNVTFSPSSPGPKALLALTLVCKTTHHIATKLLIQRCLYVSSDNAAKCVAEGLLTRFSRDKIEENNGLILEPTQAVIHIKYREPEQTTRGWAKLWQQDQLDLYTEAFDALFSQVRDCLKRLVLNSHFHTYAALSFIGPTYARVRDSYKQLRAIEEFYCPEIDYELGLGGLDVFPIWSFWPRIRRLALHSPELRSEKIMEGLMSLNHLTHLFILDSTSITESFIPHILSSFSQTIENLTVVRSVFLGFGQPHGARNFVKITKHFQNSSTHSVEKEFVTGFAPVQIEPEDTSGWANWFFDLIQEGALWDLQPTADSLKNDAGVIIEV